jgi:hypothetical protein
VVGGWVVAVVAVVMGCDLVGCREWKIVLKMKAMMVTMEVMSLVLERLTVVVWVRWGCVSRWW